MRRSPVGGVAASTRCSSGRRTYVVHETARRRPVRGDDLADRGRHATGVPGDRVRAEAGGSPPDGCQCRSDQLDEVDQVLRRGEAPPTCTGYGRGGTWAKAEDAARKEVTTWQIASELIRLYSERMASPGFDFGPGHPWQRELETPSPKWMTRPARRHRRGKVDMERLVPMDGDSAGTSDTQDRDRVRARSRRWAGSAKAGSPCWCRPRCGPAALLDVIRSATPLSRSRCGRCQVQGARRRRGPGAGSPTAPWTWSSARTS